jgi:hypothetical protein
MHIKGWDEKTNDSRWYKMRTKRLNTHAYNGSPVINNSCRSSWFW